MNQCIYCQRDCVNPGGLKAHQPYCKSNPNREQRTKSPNAHRKKGSVAWNKGLTKATNPTLARPNQIGKRFGASLSGHTEESKRKIGIGGRKSGHRRLVKSVRPYTRKDGSIIMLDSSWEEVVAMRLDDLNINWIRPDPIKWFDANGLDHHYFPDFYLPDYDIYLDPKNPQAFKVQQPKIICLREQIPNLFFLRTLDECKNYKP